MYFLIGYYIFFYADSIFQTGSYAAVVRGGGCDYHKLCAPNGALACG